MVALLLQLSCTFKAQALNVHTEIKADPPGIVRIIDRTGEPPPGRVNSEGNGLTAPATSPNADSGQPGEPEPTPPLKNSATPPGIEKVIRKTGVPPPGLISPKGSRPAVLTINTDIDFGTAFPGETQQGEFIVYLAGVDEDEWEDEWEEETSVTYSITLSNPDFVDMRPYVIVERDTGESDNEPDGIADGTNGDYAANGTLDASESSEDESDRWLVTFYVPDSITEGDYGLQILIQVDSEEP